MRALSKTQLGKQMNFSVKEHKTEGTLRLSKNSSYVDASSLTGKGEAMDSTMKNICKKKKENLFSSKQLNQNHVLSITNCLYMSTTSNTREHEYMTTNSATTIYTGKHVKRAAILLQFVETGATPQTT